MKQVALFALLAASIGLVPAARAQTTFCLGAQVGANLSSLHYSDEFYSSTLRPGLEAGLLATWQYQHWSLQPGVRFSQQGVFLEQGFYDASQADYRLNYLSIPLNVAYTTRPGGQGLQVFAGPYLSVLLGGSYYYHASYYTPTEERGSVRAGGLNATDEYYHTKRLDAGLQAGAGYRFNHLLAQVSGSVGLRNLAASKFDPAGNLPGSPYYSRSLRLSVIYLFQLKS